jgi:pyruvate dehydrogenase E2 component (dihydrolipoamide acetyltransferase)
MITRVILAKLSPTMEEGTVVKWSKQEGDTVKQGDVLAEIETDKANMEMESLGAGVLRKILVPAGGKAPVGALIGVIAAPDEDIAEVLSVAPAPAAAPSPPAPSAPAPAPAPAAGPAPSPPSPPREAPPAQLAPQPEARPPVGGEGRIKASPLARSIAAERGISLSSLEGSGPGGRIVKRDVESAGAAPSAAPAARSAAGPGVLPFPSQGPQELPVSSMRKTIAKRLSESKFTAPHFYVTVEIDMRPAIEVREQLLQGENTKVSFNDLVVKACARALTRFPLVNASWKGDTIMSHGDVHVGVAVAIPDGLITPVVRHADRKSVLEISREVKDLAGRAREKKLRPEEFTGSTFTISNLGMYDVTEFTAIINPPESAILAVGAARQVPVVDGDRVVVGHRMKVTMSCDHRVVDGALAAQFLAEVRRLLENPVSLFL